MQEEDLLRFYSAIWAPAGWVCLAKPYRHSKGMNHMWEPSAETMLHKYRGMLDGRSLFHSVATYRRIDGGDNLKGKEAGVGELRRFKEAVLWSKCGHNEIDIREGEDSYANADEVIRAIEPIERELRQRALIIWSGSGVHLYWVYRGPVDYDTWRSDTIFRESLFRRYKIKGHDEPVAKDRTRLLRVPGSINEKYNKPVELIRWHDCERSPRFVSLERQALQQREQEFEDNRYSRLTPEFLAEQCLQVRQLRDNPEKQTYNEWLGCASILKRIPDGREKFLTWSSKDEARFNEESAEEKMDSLTGYDCFSCEAMAEALNSVCGLCCHNKRKLSPLKVASAALASQAPVIEPADMPLPEGYTIQDDKIVVASTNVQLKAQAGLPISSRPFYVDGLYIDEATDNQTLLVRYTDSIGKRWLQASAPMGKAISSPGLVFGDKFAINDRAKAYIFDSLTMYERRMQAEGRDRLLPIVKYVGWHKSTKGEFCFNYGDSIISERGTYKVIVDPNNVRIKEIAGYMEVATNDPYELEQRYQTWQLLACEYANDDSVPLACKVFFLLGFVAPTIRLISEGHQFGGIVANIWGETSWGKTLSLIAATSIYGTKKLILPVNVSEAALYHSISCIPNLPICIDEFTSSQIFQNGPKAIHDFIKSFADGSSPARMNADGTPRASKNWNTLAMTSANVRYVDHMRAYGDQEDVRAAEMRVAELPLPGASEKARMEALRSQDYSAFERLTGIAGPRWIRHLCKPTVQASLNAWVASYRCDELPEEARYLIKLAALMEWTMKELWNETRPCWLDDGCLGMVKFPHKEIMDYYFASQVSHTKESKAVHALPSIQQSIINFLDEQKQFCAQYTTYPKGYVTAPRRKKELRPVNDDMTHIRNGGATNSFVIDTAMHYIPHNILMNYHNKRMGSRGFSAEIEKLRLQGVTKKVNHRVSGYINYENGEEPCWCFPRDVIEKWMKG